MASPKGTRGSPEGSPKGPHGTLRLAPDLKPFENHPKPGIVSSVGGTLCEWDVITS